MHFGIEFDNWIVSLKNFNSTIELKLFLKRCKLVKEALKIEHDVWKKYLKKHIKFFEKKHFLMHLYLRIG